MSEDSLAVSCVLTAQALNGECPCWDPREQCLYWIDVPAGTVHRFDPATGNDAHWQMPTKIGSLALGPEGKLIVALRTGVYRFDCVTGSLELLAPVPFNARQFFLNDGKCDREGRFWVGPMFDPLEPVSLGPQTAPLLCLEPDGLRLRPVVSGVRISNGLAWSPDGRRMYHADTQKKAVFAFDFDLETASLRNERTFAVLAAPEGGPDGGAVDAEGHYWAAIFGGGCLVRLDPDGNVEREVRLPTKYPTMCAFGGDDLQTAFVTSSSKLVRSKGEPLAETDGGIFCFRAPVPGLPTSFASEKYFRAGPDSGFSPRVLHHESLDA